MTTPDAFVAGLWQSKFSTGEADNRDNVETGPYPIGLPTERDWIAERF